MTAKPHYPTTRDLRDYQKEGVDYLYENGNGFLWDAPGLGKTTQAIVAAHNLGGPILVVCPSTLRPWWKAEILSLYPHYKGDILVAHTAGRIGKTLPHYIYMRDNDAYPTWTIVHYEGVRINQKSYAVIPWSVVIADECHYIKNRNAKRSKALHAVTPALAYHIGLTATPFANNPGDLWNQLRWAQPQIQGLKSYWRFDKAFVERETRTFNGRQVRVIKGGKNLDMLAKVMSAYGLQRTKQQVAPQLPPLQETEMPIELTGRQLKVYKEMTKSSRVELGIRHSTTSENGHAIEGGVQGPGELDVTHIVIKNALARLIKMERWLSSPWAYDPIIRGGKLDWLKEWMEGNTEPALVVTRFKASARGIHKHLPEGSAGASAIEGDVPSKQRAAIIEAWQAGEFQYLVGTIHTLGTGLNLDKAHTMICYDQVWNAILMSQVRERIHRLTTDHPVQVIYLYFENTSNELVLEGFKRKWRDMELVKKFIAQLRGE